MTELLPSRRTLLGTLAFAIVAVFTAILPGAAQAQTPAGTPHLLLQLETGTVDIELEPNLAPNHVKQIVKLTEEGFYDGIVFHRVIDGFMAQTGDPTGTGMGGSELPDLKAEFSDEPFVRGTLGMARSQDPNSANSQFFIMFDEGSFLNGQYTVFGKVVSGMEFVDELKKGSKQDNGTVENPDKIVKASIEYRE